jgi:hypothetical protein
VRFTGLGVRLITSCDRLDLGGRRLRREDRTIMQPTTSLTSNRIGVVHLTVCAWLAVVLLAGGCGKSKCEGTLQEMGAGCQASFDGTLAGFPACPAVGGMTQEAWRCDDLLVLSNSGYGGLSCYYDATSHALVGAYAWNDTPSFCGDSFNKSAGRTPPTSCAGTVDRVERSCPVGGAVDAGP